MRHTRIIMGMPVTVDIIGQDVSITNLDHVFDYFVGVDEQFSPFKSSSEVSRFNAGRLQRHQLSSSFQTVLHLSEETKVMSNGFFDIFRRGRCDPSGLVKGWAIHQAATMIRAMGYPDFYVEAGGDIEVGGWGPDGQPWQIGLRHPFQLDRLVKVIQLTNQGVATSGTYERGSHIYNPLTDRVASTDIVSLTVIGPNVYEADRFATAAFAMGRSGIAFIANRRDLEGYMIDRSGQATMTSGFERYVVTP